MGDAFGTVDVDAEQVMAAGAFEFDLDDFNAGGRGGLFGNSRDARDGLRAGELRGCRDGRGFQGSSNKAFVQQSFYPTESGPIKKWASAHSHGSTVKDIITELVGWAAIEKRVLANRRAGQKMRFGLRRRGLAQICQNCSDL